MSTLPRKKGKKTSGAETRFQHRTNLCYETLGRQLRLGDFHELGEGSRIVHSQIRENLAVDGDVVLLQPIDERGIAHAVQASSGVDTGDPQGAEITLAQLAALEGIAQGTSNLFGRGAVLLGLCTPVALIERAKSCNRTCQKLQ